ncbi:sugar phosphate isomerase/epimerase [Gryllotalpicola kribbensis]|uniref:Sugar phosphate isomerase/epimerase n=1 Tax=Gryllotalpicola kribbensis TaxID=993084 RepID=A0ABP8AK11_9MICO
MTTWTLSGFADEIDAEPDIQFSVLAALGARHIELRSAWSTNVAEFTEEQLDGVARSLSRRGMQVSAIGSPVGKVEVSAPVDHEVARLKRVIAVAHRVQARYIRVFSFWPAGHANGSHSLAAGALPDDTAASMRDAVLARMRALADVAEREDVVLLHENEKDIYGDTPERVLDLIESVGSDRLRVAWDSANFVQCGVEPFTRAYPLLKSHLEYLQVKDARFSDGEVTPAGEGDGQLLETMTALRDDGYSGFASLEPHLALSAENGGFSGPYEFGRAARAFRRLLEQIGVDAA